MTPAGPNTPEPGPFIVIPARTGYGGFRVYDRRGEPQPTGWYKDRAMAQGIARRMNTEAATESGSPPAEQRA